MNSTSYYLKYKKGLKWRPLHYKNLLRGVLTYLVWDWKQKALSAFPPKWKSLKSDVSRCVCLVISHFCCCSSKSSPALRKFFMVLVSLSCPLSAAEMMPESRVMRFSPVAVWFLVCKDFWKLDGVIKEDLFFMLTPWSQNSSWIPVKGQWRLPWRPPVFHCQKWYE